LLDLLAPVVEFHYDATNAVCAGFAYSERPSDIFVNLAVYPKHVTLIFPWGLNLSDPEGRLKGEGKRVRNIRLTGLETLQEPYVLDLIKHAVDGARRQAGFLPATVVKIYDGPKRR
jgi:hypothetical protein